jgi:cell division cycle 20-like protein 1 (cofactor of APC complex)
MNSFHFAAIAWSPQHHGLFASGGGTADHCIRFWNTLTGQRVQRVDTGSQVSNLAWARDSSELVSFLHTKTVLSLVTGMVF